MIITRRLLNVLCSAAVAWCITSSGNLQAIEPKPEYLSDALSDRVTYGQAWGELGLNTAVKPTNGTAAKLRIKDKEYEHGLGHHANGEIVVALEGLYQTFDCEVGVQWQGGKSQGSVIFQVFVDDKKVFDSGVMRENDPAQNVRVLVKNADVLRLIADDAGDGITCDCADWADARLTSDPASKGRIAQPAVDIARFARVVTSDPKRMTGTAASRVQEVPAADVFLETELKPAAGGGYAVPTKTDGPSCIGLRWYEMRCLRRLELHWADATATPAADAVQLQQWVGISPTQYWTGSSPWQGQWKPLPAKFEQSQGVWSWQIADKDQPAGTYRVRWVFPASKQPIVLKNISAYSRSSWTTADLRAELQKPTADKQAQVVVSNGELLGPAERKVALASTWNLSKPLDLKVRYSKPRPHKADRTVLRFELPGQPVSVAVEDVLANGCVYIPSAGLLVTLNPPQSTLAHYLQEIAGKKTVLEQVRSQPDQTFSQAMAKTHNPIQKNGPMLASLACDNRKYVVHRDGTISFHPANTPDGAYPEVLFLGIDPQARDCQQIVPHFGSGKNERLERHLDGGWLPAPVTTIKEGGVVYSERTYVAPVDLQSPAGSPAWLRDRAVCVAEYTIENSRPDRVEVSLGLTLLLNAKTSQHANLEKVKEGFLAVQGDRVFAMIETGQTMPLNAISDSAVIRFAGTLPAGGKARLFVYLPAWKLRRAEYAVLLGGTKWASAMKAYWNDILRPAMRVELPDGLLTNVIRASQVHCMLAARNEDRGRYVAPWVGADRYGPLESESQAVIRGMDMTGCDDFARRGLEFFLKRYNAQGFLTTGYTLVGTGENLWTIAEHQARCGDLEWFKKTAPQLVRACKWIVAQRAKTKHLDADGGKVPEYGLMPLGVTADWERYAYRFYYDAQYCHGLETAAQELAAIGHPDAPALLVEAKQYREDLLRAYRWTQNRCPVVPLANGTWVPNHPAMLDIFGNVEELIAPNEDANRSWCYGVEIGSHHLAANRLLDPNSAEGAQIMDYLEDHQFLRSGSGDYPEEQNRKDVFNLGGFSKVQPYYSRNAEIYALRDDVKPFVRSYFNALSSLLNEETLSLWEHFHNGGGWNKTHETGWFLCQTAMMFVMERGDDLWLAPMVTDNWMKDGMTVAVRNAPTRFGNVSYSITSSVASGHIDAEIQPPTRETLNRLVIRLRHPEGKAICSVTVNGKPHRDFDPCKECVSIQPTGKRMTVRAEY
jgi:hypothetical protein